MQLETTFIATALLLASTACSTTHGTAHSHSPKEQEEMMAKMMQLATPSDAHKQLGEMVGRWEQKYKMRMEPNGPWMDSTGTSECKSLLDGRYIMETLTINMPEMPGMGAMPPMQAVQILGFDNMTGEYTSIWMDSMSTWAISSRGKKAKDGTVTLTGTMNDVAGERPFYLVMKHGPEGHVHGEMYDTVDGKKVEMMILDSTKK